jgi:xylulose-5-phosphate/fructose-6-phosphate phosphoketolase
MAASMRWALSEIKKIQKAARSGNPIVKPRWPVLVLRTPKVGILMSMIIFVSSHSRIQGWSGPKECHGEYIEGSFNSHGIPLPNAATDDEEFTLLSNWLASYRPMELFDNNGRPVPEILSIIPEREDRRMGQNKLAYAAYVPIDVPDWKKFVVKKGVEESCMRCVGDLLHDVVAS